MMGINALQRLIGKTGGHTARAAVLATWGVAGLSCGVQPLLHDVDAVALRWSEHVTASGTVYQSQPLPLAPGAYRVTMRLRVSSEPVHPFDSVRLELETAQGVPPEAQLSIPMPVETSAVVTAKALVHVSHKAQHGVRLKISSTATSELIFEDLRLRRKPAWWHAVVKLAGPPAYGQASLRVHGLLNTTPPWYRYEPVGGTNHAKITAAWPWMQYYEGVTQHSNDLVLARGAGVRAVAHHLAVRPNTWYCLRVCTRFTPVHTRTDEVRVDLFSALPLYDPPEAELVATIAPAQHGPRIHEHYFKTHETPPAVMLRIMATLGSPLDVAWITLSEASWWDYARHRLLQPLTNMPWPLLVTLLVIVMSSGLIGLMDCHQRTIKLTSTAAMCGVVCASMAYALSADGHLLSGTALNIAAASILLVYTPGWWLLRMYAWSTNEPVMQCGGAALGFAWLTCGLCLGMSCMTLTEALAALVMLSILLAVSAFVLPRRHPSCTMDIRDMVVAASLVVLSLLLLLSPFRDQPVLGFFTECVDGFMYAASADYLRDAARAEREWHYHALSYVKQVLYVVRRIGIGVTYAALNYLAGQTADVTYRIWHSCLHALCSVTLFCMSRVLGVGLWAAWMAGCCMLVIPVAQLPLYGNSLAQTAGLLLLAGIALVGVVVIHKPLPLRGYVLSGLCSILAVAGVWLVYRELVMYIICVAGTYLGLRLICSAAASPRGRRILGAVLCAGILAAAGVYAYVDLSPVIQHVRKMVTAVFPYFNEGDINVLLSPLHVAGGFDVVYAAGYAAQPVLWPPLSAVCAAAMGVLMIAGVVAMPGKMRYAAFAFVLVCAALCGVLMMVYPWPYALKKHLSVCAMGGAVLAAAGCDWLLACCQSRWQRAAAGAGITLVVLLNALLVWNMFAWTALMPHYFDRESEHIRTAVRARAPRLAPVFVHTSQRPEKFIYTLRDFNVMQSHPEAASFAILQRDQLDHYAELWIGHDDQHEIVAETTRYLLLSKRGGQ